MEVSLWRCCRYIFQWSQRFCQECSNALFHLFSIPTFRSLSTSYVWNEILLLIAAIGKLWSFHMITISQMHTYHHHHTHHIWHTTLHRTCHFMKPPKKQPSRRLVIVDSYNEGLWGLLYISRMNLGKDWDIKETNLAWRMQPIWMACLIGSCSLHWTGEPVSHSYLFSQDRGRMGSGEGIKICQQVHIKKWNQVHLIYICIEFFL